MTATPTPTPPTTPPARFRTTVHGTVFAGRDRHLDRLSAGDALLLIPDPPGGGPPSVWVHLASGDPVGHLPPEIGSWLAPWLLLGGRALARVARVGGADVPSWRRLVLDVRCPGGEDARFGGPEAAWAT